tara:strand:+ start:2122 stop:2586 length:465 start_codon:yes stop_codon:yes gene_type:complete
MNFIYFICPENPKLAKYCEGFYNYLTYGYRNWTRDRYVSSVPKEKAGKSRLLMNKTSPHREEMKAGDVVLERIYEKVITTDCYEQFYSKITEAEIEQSKLVVFITSNKKPIPTPRYLFTSTNSVVVWKVSKVNEVTSKKYDLLEILLRKLADPR